MGGLDGSLVVGRGAGATNISGQVTFCLNVV